MTPELNDSHRRTYDCTFRHPAARNLGWGDVRSMIGSLAKVARKPKENLRVTRNGPKSAQHPSPEENLY